jgi:hypothetical protein
MSVKVIQITILSENILPDIINSFSPEKNYQMLKIGCESLNEGRKYKLSNSTSFSFVLKRFIKAFMKNSYNII